MTHPPLLQRIQSLWTPIARLLDLMRPAAVLGARLYVAQVFVLSGLTKLRDWDTTLLLFTEEYHVPLLPPAVAAVAGTAGELALPVLLTLGLAGRFAALGLSVVNGVAVLSLAEIAPAALQLHVTWGVLLGALVFHGMDRWSLDHRLALSRRPGSCLTAS
ncbi:DoxX family protein [Hydrogenophaga sp.]|uniref:DoxX family protein n=1 Tax=Hydrogenophaga sp. TaxID=1904254 RepID=UPI00260C9152|nr:DoxX family protein [Hydrogenophaga sp.]MCW5653369.1 DoxX family protein [Hydrogenophaga sp.]